MRVNPYRLKAVDAYWRYAQSPPTEEESHEDLKSFASEAIIALEATLQRIHTAATGQGMLTDVLSAEEVIILLRGKQSLICKMERLLDAAYDLYADDGYLITKEEWLEALQCHVKESEE